MKSKIGSSEAVTRSLLDILKESGEMTLLPGVAKELEDELNKTAPPKEALVSSASEMKDDRKKDLEKALSGFLNQEVPFTYRTDASLLGGFTVQIGEWFLDASIRHELNKLKNTLES